MIDVSRLHIFCDLADEYGMGDGIMAFEHEHDFGQELNR